MQTLGGMGYMRGTRSERIYREVKVNMIGGGAEERQGLGPRAALEQEQAIVVRRQDMTLGGSAAKQLLGLGQILRYAFAQLVGLAHVELRIGIALGRRAEPLLDRSLMLSARPCIDARLDVGPRGSFSWREYFDALLFSLYA